MPYGGGGGGKGMPPYWACIAASWLAIARWPCIATAASASCEHGRSRRGGLLLHGQHGHLLLLLLLGAKGEGHHAGEALHTHRSSCSPGGTYAQT